MSNAAVLANMRENYEGFLAQMREIDSRLGVTGMSRTACLNRHANNNAEATEWAKGIAENIRSLVDDDLDTAVAYIRALYLQTNQTFKKAVDAWAEANVPKVESNGEKVSDEETLVLKTQYNDIQEQAAAIYTVLALMDKENVCEAPPKAKRLAAGPRGKRLKGNFNWVIDGHEHASLSMGKAAQVVGIQAGAIRDAIVAMYGEDFDFANPPSSFSVRVGEHTFAAVRAEGNVDDDEVDDDDFDDDDEDEDDDL